MYINKEWNLKEGTWNLKDTLNFIEYCLIAYEKIKIKDKNSLICYEIEYDTLDFNEVPYVLRNEFEIPEYVNFQIKKLEILIKQLFNDKEIKGNNKKNGIYFLLEFNNNIYVLNYENRVMTFSKIKKNINFSLNNLEIIKFEQLENYINKNQENMIIK